MSATLTKHARVLAALRGTDVDRVPVSAWGHDFLREWSSEALAAATLEAYRRYDWDFVKVNPRATHFAEDWGSRFRPSGRPDAGPELIEPAVKSVDDLRRIQPLDVRAGAYGEQLTALQVIAEQLAGEAPCIHTVFCPLAVMTRLAGSTAAVQQLMREAGDEVLAALQVVARTLADYARAAVAAGASGIFFATVEWGSRTHLSVEDHDRFARPFDLVVLEAVREAPFNVLHVCRDNNLLEHLLDYPVAAFHWASHQPGNPSLAAVLGRIRQAVLGGVSHEGALLGGSPEEVAQEAARALRETGGRRFLLAPGCTVDPRAPEANLRALRGAVGAAVA